MRKRKKSKKKVIVILILLIITLFTTFKIYFKNTELKDIEKIITIESNEPN